MVSTNDLKMNIINLISRINDLNKLKLIYRKVEQVDKSLEEINNTDRKLDFKNAVVHIREGVTYQQILQEQNYKQISYQEFRKVADQVEWDHSLEELLEALD